MAGTIVGSIDHRIGDGAITAPDLNQNAFVVLYNFFNTTMVGAGHCTLVANNFGASGTGFDFHDEANPAGENAWAAFRFPNSATPFTILIQWTDAALFGTTPGNPGSLQGSTNTDGIGMMMALREDGTDPWGGTTAADGTDTKGTTVWHPSASPLHVMGRSMAIGPTVGGFYLGSTAVTSETTGVTDGTTTFTDASANFTGDGVAVGDLLDIPSGAAAGQYIVAGSITMTTLALDRTAASDTGITYTITRNAKQNMFRSVEDLATTTFTRMHMIGDADGFIIMTDRSNDGTYKCTYAGKYTARAGLTPPEPYCFVNHNNTGSPGSTSGFFSLGSTNIWGSVAGTSSSTFEGGILGNQIADGVRGFSMSTASSGVADVNYQPNQQPVTPELDAFAVTLFQREQNQGLCGTLPTALLAGVFNSNNLDTNGAATRAYMAVTTVADTKFSIPWDGGSSPGTLNTRTGRQF